LKIQVNFDELRKKKLFVATPMYGGLAYGTYARAIAELVTLFNNHKIPLQLYSLFNESLITRARAYACDEFLRSDSTHLLFLDADIGFNPNDVLAMMALQVNDSKYDIIGAPYPKKCIAWEKIKLAVDKGFADKDPRQLDQFVGDFVFNPLPGTTSFSVTEPAEMLELGTGFMMITRETLEDFEKAYPEYMFKPDHVRTEHFDGSREICMFFQAEIDRSTVKIERMYREALEKIVQNQGDASTAAETIAQVDEILKNSSKRYLSEDYNFCQMARAIGKRVWLAPWIQTTHTGTLVFGGSVAAMGALGTSATADVSMLKKGNQPTPSNKTIRKRKK
jgi:hypothetical protein